MAYFRIIFILLLLPEILFAQGVYSSVDNSRTHLIDREQIIRNQFDSLIHPSTKPYKRKDIAEFIEVLDSTDKVSSFNRQFLLIENHEWSSEKAMSKRPFLKHFYTRPADALYFKYKDRFEIHANPLLHLSGSMELNSKDSESSRRNLYRNTRGAEIRGLISDKVGFMASVTENQVRFPSYVEAYDTVNGTLPGVGFQKPFGANGYDYFIARGYFTANITDEIAIQFGQDQNFIGNGYRSMILSDFSTPYLFLKAETKVWKIKYTNIFAQLVADTRRIERRYPRKYMAFHHLSMNIGKRLNIGLFETVMFGRGDTLGNDYGFDLSYLNPVIFYRAVEQNLGSPDNVILGMDFNWLFRKNYSLYGQFLLDELVVSNLRAQNGWWANKFAIQAGIKHVNAFGIKNLDLQVEFNTARPYTYSHFSNSSDYQHFAQALAHPLGANFHEAIAIVRYQPLEKLNIELKAFKIAIGRDPSIFEDTVANYGQNINADYRERVRDFGNQTTQGIRQDLHLVQLNISYMLKHDLFLDFNYTGRFSNFNEEDLSNLLTNPGRISRTNVSHIPGISLRWNLPHSNYDF